MRQSVSGKWSRKKRMKLLRENAELKARLRFPQTPNPFERVTQQPVETVVSKQYCSIDEPIIMSAVKWEITRNIAECLFDNNVIEFDEDYQDPYKPDRVIAVRGKLRVVMPRENSYAR